MTTLLITYIRRVYRFKGELGAESPSHIDFKEPRNRAGYLAAFGERHAYLAYAHLKMVQAVDPSAIPAPDNNGELTVTLVGAGPAIETYGLCLFYNESAHQLKGLTLNLIDKIREWQPTRDMVLSGLIKQVLPKLDIFSDPIEADLTETSCVQTFAAHHDSLVRTRLLIVYNVLNEIESTHAHMVLRNLGYIVRQCEQPLLLLFAEPTAKKAWPRIRWFRELLIDYATVILDDPNEEISFYEEPTNIAMSGVNERLFSRAVGKNPPVFETTLKRVLMACKMIPQPPFSAQQYEQLRRLQFRRDRKGRIVREPVADSNRQLTLFS